MNAHEKAVAERPMSTIPSFEIYALRYARTVAIVMRI